MLILVVIDRDRGRVWISVQRFCGLLVAKMRGVSLNIRIFVLFGKWRVMNDIQNYVSFMIVTALVWNSSVHGIGEELNHCGEISQFCIHSDNGFGSIMKYRPEHSSLCQTKTYSNHGDERKVDGQ